MTIIFEKGVKGIGSVVEGKTATASDSVLGAGTIGDKPAPFEPIDNVMTDSTNANAKCT